MLALSVTFISHSPFNCNIADIWSSWKTVHDIFISCLQIALRVMIKQWLRQWNSPENSRKQPTLTFPWLTHLYHKCPVGVLFTETSFVMSNICPLIAFIRFMQRGQTIFLFISSTCSYPLEHLITDAEIIFYSNNSTCVAIVSTWDSPLFYKLWEILLGCVGVELHSVLTLERRYYSNFTAGIEIWKIHYLQAVSVDAVEATIYCISYFLIKALWILQCGFADLHSWERLVENTSNN